jgi:predicted metalloprotease with PDZ domain
MFNRLTVGVTLTATTIVLGIVGVILQAGGVLPEEYTVPVVGTVLTVVSVLISTLGLQDQLNESTRSIIEIVRSFFTGSPYRMMGLTILLTIANEIVAGIETFPSNVVLGARIFLTLASVFSFGTGIVQGQIKSLKINNK